MTNSFRMNSGSLGLIVPIVRRLRAPIGAFVPGRIVPISFSVRVRGPARR